MIDANEFFNSTVLCTLFILLVAAVVTDLRTHRIPNVLLAPALSLAFLLNTLHDGGIGFISAAAGLAVGILMFLPLYVVRGMGAGDVKLLGVVGSFIGPWGAVVAGMATMMVGAVFGIIALVWRYGQPAFGMFVDQLTGPPPGAIHEPKVISSAQRPGESIQLAYAPAIAVGTALALWYIGMLPEKLLG